MADQDNLAALSKPIFQPIQPSTPAYQGAPQQPNGWEGKTGQIANLATQFLAGASKGRAQAYDREQQNQMRQVAAIQSAIGAVDSSQASDQIKSQQKTQLMQLYGRLIQGSLQDVGSTKGKKGGDQSEGGGTHPLLAGMKGALDSLLGPAPKKNDMTPEKIDATLGQVFASISNPQNSQQAFTQQLEQPVNAAHAQAVQKNGGKPLTFAQMMSDPTLKPLIDQNMAKNGGQPTAGVSGLLQSGQQYEKDQQTAAQQSNYASEADWHKAQADEARATTAKIEQETKNLANGPPVKYTGEMGERVQIQRVIDDPKASPSDRKAASATLKSLNEKQKGVEVRIENAQNKLAEDKSDKVGGATSKVQYVPNGPSLANPKGEGDIDVMAWEFINTGHLPLSGVRTSKSTQDKRERAIARSGEILSDFGMSPAELPALRGRIKGYSGALSKITTLGAQVSQFEGTLEKNLTIAQKLDADYKRGGIPAINAVIAAFKTGKGDPEALNLAGQLHGISREWAKIMAGSTSAAGVAIGEAKDADALMSRNMTSGQLTSFFDNVIRPDAKNRLAAVDEERQGIIQQLRSPTGEVSQNNNGAPPSRPGSISSNGLQTRPAAKSDGAPPESPGAKPPAVTTKSQFDALPSGTIYVEYDDKGKPQQYRKP